MNAARWKVRVCPGRFARARSPLAEKLSYASINWIRFKGSPERAISRRPLASQPPTGAPLAGMKVVRVTLEVNHTRDLRRWGV
jgi:hypothetical protein